MKLSEKIIELRKENRMTQEKPASICNVRRQSISKWESDIALPETDKLLILEKIFQVSMDVLLKCGIANKNINVYDLHTGMEIEELQQYDVVYLCGGNTRDLPDGIEIIGK